MLALLGCGGKQGIDIGDNVPNSLMVDSSLSQYLSRTPGVTGNTQTFTFSTWIKRGKLGAIQGIFEGYSTGLALSGLYFTATDTIALQLYSNPTYNTVWETAAKFRDTSAPLHVVLVFDTTQAVQANMMKLYINGVLQTFGYTNYNSAIPQNSGWYYNSSAYIQRIGLNNATYPADGYQSRTIMVDGQALDASSFGRTSVDTGAWVNKTYTGTYGTTGFKLEFLNGASLGTDTSGNGNNWTLNGGITSVNQFTDTPTNNYCTLNSLIPASLNAAILSKGNLKGAFSTSTQQNAFGNMPLPKSGEWYAECQVVLGGTPYGVAVGVTSNPSSVSLTSDTLGYAYYNADGNKYVAAVPSAYGTAWYGASRTDVIGIKYNANTGQLTFYLNGVSQGVATTLSTALNYYLAGSHISGSGTHTENWNFGAAAFTYPANQGTALPLCTANLPQPSIIRPAKYFKAKTRTGTGAAASITGIEFSPDFVWVKSRNAATSHVLANLVVGATKFLSSNTTGAETTDAQSVTAFNSDGFSVGTAAILNTNTATYVDWMWKAGGAAIANAAGSISSQVSVSTIDGVSVVTYTGNGVNNATVGHGLGVVPAMVVVKKRNAASTDWRVKHRGLTTGNNLGLDQTLAQYAVASATTDGGIGDLSSSTVFTLIQGTSNLNQVNNNTDTYVAYCFAEVEGFSKFGSYIGNSSLDGTFANCGFRPQFVLLKRIDSTGGEWRAVDTSRDTYNTAQAMLRLNDILAEGASVVCDLLSNGFKLKSTDAQLNATGGTYVFAAFAEMPFKYANAR